jgi:hyaluronoglucosaminidase
MFVAGQAAVIAGVIEGFYGPPWSHRERLDLIAFCGEEGFRDWVHAPKDDPYHRQLWREPYPGHELELLAELAAACTSAGVELAWAAAPGLDIRYSDPRELETLAAKWQSVSAAGASSLQLLWDDVGRRLRDPDDRRRYGSVGEAQADFTNRLRARCLDGAPLVVCPLDYAGTKRSAYRDSFGSTLDRGAIVYWTGPEVVSKRIAVADLDRARSAFGHELVLWDNYPVNDFEPERLFLGPLRGRDPSLLAGCAGLIANPMVQAIPSKLPLATVADFLRDPAGYDPERSFDRALRRYGEEVVEALRRAPQTSLAASLGPGATAAAALALLEERA